MRGVHGLTGADVDQSSEPAIAHTEAVLMRYAVLARLVAALHVVAWLIMADERGLGPTGAALAIVTGGHGVLTILACVRARGVQPHWAVGDALFSAGMLAAGAWIAAGGDYDPWRFGFPYSVSAVLIVGIARLPLRRMLAVQAIPVATYAACGLLVRPDGAWNIPQDLVTYLGVLLASRVLAAEFRRSARTIDQARIRELRRQAEFSAIHERNRYGRELHDHVLQTLEALGRGRFISDDRMRALVTREAFRLRRLVEEPDELDGPDRRCLESALSAVVSDHLALGLRVDLRYAHTRERVPSVAAEAVAGAVNEALTNVRKHAGADQAIVQITSTADAVSVTVVDHGRGFDPNQPWDGVGLRESIFARMHEAGGEASVDSAPDGGTCVEVRLPARSGSGAAAS
jgi:signal transduction histidine kinase